MIERQDILDHLAIDETDDVVLRKIDRYLNIAKRWIIGSVGKDVNLNDERAEELMLSYVDDLYYNRGISSNKESAVTRQMVNDFVMQLKMENRSSDGM